MQVIKQENKVVALKRWSSGQLPLYYSQGMCDVCWWNRLRLNIIYGSVQNMDPHSGCPLGDLLDPYLDPPSFFAEKLDLYDNEVYLISEAKCKEWMNSHFCWVKEPLHCHLFMEVPLTNFVFSFTLKTRIIKWLLPFIISLIVAKNCVFLSIL